MKAILIIIGSSLFIMAIPMGLIMAWPVVFAIFTLQYLLDRTEECTVICFVPIMIFCFNFGLVCNVIAIPLILLVGPFVICYMIAQIGEE